MRRPNLSLFTLLCVLMAMPIVHWYVHWRGGSEQSEQIARPVAATAHVPLEQLAAEIPAARWADSAIETADRITELGRCGHIRDAIDLTEHALALPRHPTFNNPFGRGHATLALDRMLAIFEAYELWDEAISFCTAADAVAVGNALIESKRLRLLAVAFAHKRQLTFRSRILTQQLSDTREELDWREGVDEHHNEICVPEDVIEIDYAGHEAARKHIRESIELIETLRQLRTDPTAVATSDKLQALSPIHRSRILVRHGDADAAVAAAAELVQGSDFDAAARTVFAEVLLAASRPDDARKQLQQITDLETAAAPGSPLHRRLMKLATALDTELPATAVTCDAQLPEGESLPDEFPLAVPAPGFRLPGVNREHRTLAEFRGRPLLLVFYLGDGCLHCARQLKHLAPAAQDFEELGIEILGVSTDDAEVLEESFANYRGRIPFPLVSDSDLNVFAAYGLHRGADVEPLHGTFLIDETGQVIWRDSGDEPFMDVTFLLDESQRLLKRTR